MKFKQIGLLAMALMIGVATMAQKPKAADLTSENLPAELLQQLNGATKQEDKMKANLYNSLMLVTALNPYIGYENAAKTAKKAYRENISLKEACVALGFLTAERFDEVFRPEEMAGE